MEGRDYEISHQGHATVHLSIYLLLPGPGCWSLELVPQLWRLKSKIGSNVTSIFLLSMSGVLASLEDMSRGRPSAAACRHACVLKAPLQSCLTTPGAMACQAPCPKRFSSRILDNFISCRGRWVLWHRRSQGQSCAGLTRVTPGPSPGSCWSHQGQRINEVPGGHSAVCNTPLLILLTTASKVKEFKNSKLRSERNCDQP